MDLDFCLTDFVRFSNSTSIQTALQVNYQRACQTSWQVIWSHVSVSSALTILAGTLLFVLLFKMKSFKRICDVMSKIPGPPTHFILGNAIMVLYLDKFNFKYGTYVCKCVLCNDLGIFLRCLISISLFFRKSALPNGNRNQSAFRRVQDL